MLDTNIFDKLALDINFTEILVGLVRIGIVRLFITSVVKNQITEIPDVAKRKNLN
jgi:hypothetical protein